MKTESAALVATLSTKEKKEWARVVDRKLPELLDSARFPLLGFQIRNYMQFSCLANFPNSLHGVIPPRPAADKTKMRRTTATVGGVVLEHLFGQAHVGRVNTLAWDKQPRHTIAQFK